MNSLFNATFALWIAIIFCVAATAKFLAWSELPGVVQNFRVLPQVLITPVSFILPFLEASVAMGLLIKVTRPWAAFFAGFLFAIFGVALAINFYRGRRQIDCGCFKSDLKQPISKAILTRNLILMICAWLLAAGGITMHSPMEWVLAGSAAWTLFFCYLSVGLLFQPRSFA